MRAPTVATDLLLATTDEVWDTQGEWPPTWHASAACRNAPSGVSWFPEIAAEQTAAIAICKTCPVIEDCRAWALAQGARLHGVWAGTSARERSRIRSQRRAA